jgi:hypothetical protein
VADLLIDYLDFLLLVHINHAQISAVHVEAADTAILSLQILIIEVFLVELLS